MTLREKVQEGGGRGGGGGGVVVGGGVWLILSKKEKEGKGVNVHPLLGNRKRRESGILHHFLVCLFSLMRFGSKVCYLAGLLCLITLRLRSLWKHRQGTWPQLGPTHQLCSHQSSTKPRLFSFIQCQTTFTPHVIFHFPSDVTTLFPPLVIQPLPLIPPLPPVTYLVMFRYKWNI